MVAYIPPQREEPLSYFDGPRHEAPWPRLFKRLEERKAELAELILRGGLDKQQYHHMSGQYLALATTIEEMQSMMRGADLPQKTDLPSVE